MKKIEINMYGVNDQHITVIPSGFKNKTIIIYEDVTGDLAAHYSTPEDIVYIFYSELKAVEVKKV